jgi:hypothetical protein
MAKHSTKEAIQAATRVVSKRGSLLLLKQALMSDGFTEPKAETIILWALQRINHNEKDSRSV